MPIESITTEEDYLKALTRLEIIFDAKNNSTEGDELEILSSLIDKYENKHFRVGFAD